MAMAVNTDKPERTFFITKKGSKKRGRPKLVKIRYEASALGILLKHDIITLAMYQAAEELIKLRSWVFQSPFVKGANLTRPQVNVSYRDRDVDTLPSDQEEDIENEYKHILTILKKNGRAGMDETMNIIIYDRLPAWFSRLLPRPGDERRRKVFLDILTDLVDHFETQINKK